ncbi:unnamed protein product, partial [Ectocarpus sp. 4 AP-2014]
ATTAATAASALARAHGTTTITGLAAITTPASTLRPPVLTTTTSPP